MLNPTPLLHVLIDVNDPTLPRLRDHALKVVHTTLSAPQPGHVALTTFCAARTQNPLSDEGLEGFEHIHTIHGFGNPSKNSTFDRLESLRIETGKADVFSALVVAVAALDEEAGSRCVLLLCDASRHDQAIDDDLETVVKEMNRLDIRCCVASPSPLPESGVLRALSTCLEERFEFTRIAPSIASAIFTRRDGTCLTLGAGASVDVGRPALLTDVDNEVRSASVSRKQLELHLSATSLTATMIGAAASCIQRRGGHAIEPLVKNAPTNVEDGDVLFLHSTGKRLAFPFTVSLLTGPAAPTAEASAPPMPAALPAHATPLLHATPSSPASLPLPAAPPAPAAPIEPAATGSGGSPSPGAARKRPREGEAEVKLEAAAKTEVKEEASEPEAKAEVEVGAPMYNGVSRAGAFALMCGAARQGQEAEATAEAKPEAEAGVKALVKAESPSKPEADDEEEKAGADKEGPTEELRIDSTDGNAYNYDSFLEVCACT